MNPLRFVADTSCLVPLLMSWHEDHRRVVDGMNRLFDQGYDIVLAAHSLLEVYAVLTRLPSPDRVSPDDARALIEDGLVATSPVVGLDPRGYVKLLSGVASKSIAGGGAYDALLAATAIKARASKLLTLNERHFDRLGLADLDIIAP